VYTPRSWLELAVQVSTSKACFTNFRGVSFKGSGLDLTLFDLILFLIFSLVLASVFLILPLLFSFFSTSPRKITPLESGFVPLDESSSHFNNQFFIILVIFVIFDLEVVLSICVICLSLNSWFFWILMLFIGATLLLE